MNFKISISNFKFQIRRGYTLVEMLVVIAIMSFIAVLSLYGMKNQDKTHLLNSTQKNFLNTLRMTQNKVNTGAGGLALQAVNTSAFVLPVGVNIITPAVTICFVNQNSANVICGGCTAGRYFACQGTVKITSGTVVVTFSNGGVINKSVYIDGNETTINRMYAD